MGSNASTCGASHFPEYLGVQADPAQILLRFIIGSGDGADFLCGQVNPEYFAGPAVWAHIYPLSFPDTFRRACIVQYSTQIGPSSRSRHRSHLKETFFTGCTLARGGVNGQALEQATATHAFSGIHIFHPGLFIHTQGHIFLWAGEIAIGRCTLLADMEGIVGIKWVAHQFIPRQRMSVFFFVVEGAHQSADPATGAYVWVVDDPCGYGNTFQCRWIWRFCGQGCAGGQARYRAKGENGARPGNEFTPGDFLALQISFQPLSSSSSNPCATACKRIWQPGYLAHFGFCLAVFRKIGR